MEIQILSAIYKLVHGSNFLIVMNYLQLENLLCDLFNMNLFMMSIISTEIQFVGFEGRTMIIIFMEEFKLWCEFPSVQGAIDDTHVGIV